MRAAMVDAVNGELGRLYAGQADVTLYGIGERAIGRQDRNGAARRRAGSALVVHRLRAGAGWRDPIDRDRGRRRRLYNIGVVYYALNDVEKAKTYYRKALDVNPKCQEAYYNLGVAFFSQQNLAEAKQNFDQLLLLNPQSDKAYVGLGAVAENTGDVAQAIELYKKTLEINPKNANAQANLQRLGQGN